MSDVRSEAGSGQPRCVTQGMAWEDTDGSDPASGHDVAGGLGAVATAAGAAGPPPAATRTIAPTTTETLDVADITRNFLMGFVLPLWLAAGVADWIRHRAAEIETTTGAKESLIHLAMLTEAAIPVVAGLFLEIASPVLALMIASFLLHDMTALWDVSYAVTLREVTPIEQHVHDYLVMVPLMAVAFIAVLHWPQLLALLRIGGRRPDWSVRLKAKPLPWRYVAGMLGAIGGAGVGSLSRGTWASAQPGGPATAAPKAARARDRGVIRWADRSPVFSRSQPSRFAPPRRASGGYAPHRESPDTARLRSSRQ